MGKRVAIIGGGIGGLCCAWFLKEQHPDWDLHLFESRDRLGGIIASQQVAGCTLEEGPDSIIATKPAGIELINALGLGDKIIRTNPQLSGSLVAKGNRLIPIPEGLYLLAPGKIWPFLTSPMVSWAGKLRMACDIVLPRRKNTDTEESLAQFVRRRLGKEALERIAQPLVSGIYTADPETLSLAHCMPQFLEMEAEHRSLIVAMRKRAQIAQKQGNGTVSGARYGLFTSLEGGLQTLTDTLVQALQGHCHIHTQTTITDLQHQNDQWLINNESPFSHCVLALPAHASAALCANALPELSQELSAIPYAGVATINLLYDRADCGSIPSAAGFVVPTCENRSIIACTIASEKYLNRCPDDKVLLRAFIGGAMGEHHLDRSDDDLVWAAHKDIVDVLPIHAGPQQQWVHRWPKAMAQPLIGHGARLKRIRTLESQYPGLILIGNAYEGVGIPDIIAQSKRAVQEL